MFDEIVIVPVYVPCASPEGFAVTVSAVDGAVVPTCGVTVNQLVLEIALNVKFAFCVDPTVTVWVAGGVVLPAGALKLNVLGDTVSDAGDESTSVTDT